MLTHLLVTGGRLLLVGVRSLLLAEANNNIQEAFVVEKAMVGTAAWLLVLLLLLDLRGVVAHLTGTGQRAVNLA